MPTKKFNLYASMGVTGVQEYAGLLSDRYAEILRGPSGIAKMARVLRREPSAYTSWNMVTLAASSVRWTVTPAAESKADQDAAEFVDQCLQDTSTSLASAVQFALSSWAFGWADHEIVWKKRNGQNPTGKDAAPSKWDDGLIGLKKLATRRQETLYKWELDETGGLQAMIQTDPNTGKQTEPIPIEKLLHYVGGDERGSIEGLGWLEPAYWIAYLIEQLEQIGGATAQRGGTGLPWFKFLSPPDDKILNAVDEIGEGLAAGELQYVKLPGPMVDGDLKTVSLSNLGDIRGWIDQLRWEIAALQAATFVRLGSTERGTQSLGGTMYDAFTMGVDGALDRIQDVWNRHLVPRMLANNPGKFGSISDHPRISHSRVTVLPPATAQWLANITEFLNVAAPEDAEWLRAIFNMPYKSAKDIEEAQKLAKADAEKAAAEAAKQLAAQAAAGELPPNTPGVVPPQLAKSAAAAANAAAGNGKPTKEPPATAPGQKAQAGTEQPEAEVKASEAQDAVASLSEPPAPETGIYPEVVRSALLMAAERIVGGQGADADVELFAHA
jgi:hypothetical protein